MNPDRKAWNQRHQTLRQSLSFPLDHTEAIRLFLEQHAAVHSSSVSGGSGWSFSDEALCGLSEAMMRMIPPGSDHSIAWLIWHMARIEDVTMNLLVAGGPTIFEDADWQNRLGANTRDTGNALNAEEIAALSASVRLDELRAYRDAVGLRTRAIAVGLRVDQMKRKVDPARLEQIMAQGAAVEATRGLLDYWGGLTTAGLLLMPPTRHNFIHLNEALKLRAALARA